MRECRAQAQAQARAVDEDVSGMLLEGSQPAGDVPWLRCRFPEEDRQPLERWGVEACTRRRHRVGSASRTTGRAASGRRRKGPEDGEAEKAAAAIHGACGFWGVK